MQPLSDQILGLGVALGVGLLIGVERERAKGTGPSRAAAGVRTFALLGLVGALAYLVGDIGVLVAGIFVTLVLLASYQRTQATDPGLTTEVAMLVTFFLGVLAMRSMPVAAGLGVVAALTTNSLMKCVVASLKGGRHYAMRVIPGIVLMVVAFAATMWLLRPA